MHLFLLLSKLIGAVSVRGDTLIDYSVEKAGDLPKWIKSNLKFVFGIDISKDNIHNHKDGACVRYLDQKLQYRDPKNFLSSIFINGNSGLNIRNGDAFSKEFASRMGVYGGVPRLHFTDQVLVLVLVLVHEVHSLVII